jgi:hypothetical protein
MSSPAQIVANRANAQLSTGPHTPAGIENSKYNATRHGLTGKQVVIKGEDPALYDALRQQLLADYAPANQREAMLVEDIAQNYWRLLRARKLEAQVLEKFGELECLLDPEAGKAFKTVTRYLNAIERSWRAGTRQLDALQNARRQEAAGQAQHAAFTALLAQRTSRPAPPIGSVSQPASNGRSTALGETT